MNKIKVFFKEFLEKIGQYRLYMSYLIELRAKLIVLQDNLIDLQIQHKSVQRDLLQAASVIELMAGELLLLKKEFEKTKLHEMPVEIKPELSVVEND